MNENFHVFAEFMSGRLRAISQHELFTVDHTDLNAAYLAAFPAGSNPVFRVRTEHDCSCCRNFVRNFGGVFAIVNGKRETLWADAGYNVPEPYHTVCVAMHDIVNQLPVSGVFRTDQPQFGSGPNFDKHNSNIKWTHLFGAVATRHKSASPDAARGERATATQVFRRGLEELTVEALDTVIDLIESNSLYRGEEHVRAVREFAQLKAIYFGCDDKDLFAWEKSDFRAARFRNTVIGSLVDDISQGVEVDAAVRMFESKVAPQNYKRPTAVITARMIDGALTTLREENLELAVERRFAVIGDVSVNDVLWVDNAAREGMRDSLRSALLAAVRLPPGDGKSATRIGIADFTADVVPGAQAMEVLVTNKHAGKFVSLTAPKHADSGKLFKWNNLIAWSYVGEVTDSIKQRVKRAGGNVQADLRVSLAWFNFDDLDLHAVCPRGHIYYGNKSGILDVDMNVSTLVRDPVENLSWNNPADGNYAISVHQFTKREFDNPGFTLEVEYNGIIQQYNHVEAISSRIQVPCFNFRVEGGKIVHFGLNPKLSGGTVSKEIWGVTTETYVPVTTLMHSPNYWEGAGDVGNKHWFFMLKDCINPDAVRGIYNEYLRGDLDRHRKVFEVLAAKTKCEPTPNQLSGLGFSSTQHDTVTVKVANGSSKRVYEVSF